MRYRFFLLALIVLSACSPVLPTQGQLPTQDTTAIAIAAEATVTAMAAAKPPAQPEPTSTAPATAATVTTIPIVSQPGQFWITYLSNHRLAVMSGDGARSTLLTNTPGFDYLPTWSPDGKRLGFLRMDGTSMQDGILHILLAGADNPSQVDPGNRYYHFTWMPDNRTLLATRNYPGAFELYLVDTESGQPKQIAKNASEIPRLSPDGRKILVRLNSGTPCTGDGCVYPNDLFLYDVASGQTTQLTGDAKPKMILGWSPDGSNIAFRLDEYQPNKTKIIQLNGTPVSVQADIPWWANDWVRSPDGDHIAYAVNNSTNGAAEVYVRPSGEGDPQRIARIEKAGNPMATINTLRWHPDNSGLVFNSWIEVYTVNLDGSDLRKIPLILENVLFDVRPSADAFSPPPVPTAPATWQLCPGALVSRIDAGKHAQVSSNPPTPNNVREGPRKSTRLVGQIQPGEKVEILNGPVCDNGLTWWEVRSLSTGLMGYTLEGDKKTYWLEPVQ